MGNTAVASQTGSLVNGVDVEALGRTLETVAAKPALGEFRFRATNRWLGGALNRSVIKGFYGAGKEDASRNKGYTFVTVSELLAVQ